MAEQNIEITILSGVSAGDVFRFPLSQGSSVRIGRSPENELVLQDPSVSRKHAEVRRSNGKFLLMDVGSSTGTLHMGFRLSPGADGARPLSDGDEFKVGEAIFRANFESEESEGATNVEEKLAEVMPDVATPLVEKLFRYKFVVLALVVALAVLVFLVPEEQKSTFPRQYHAKAMQIPQNRVIGYYKAGAGKYNQDRGHLDYAQFILPASNLLLEFEYISESEIELRIDEAVIKKLKPTGNAFQRYQMLIRDPAVGQERRLIFDNLAWPRAKGETGKIKRWAVRNVRMIPLSLAVGVDFDEKLQEQLNAVEKIRSRQEALYLAIRGLQQAMLHYLVEHKIDAAVVPLKMDSDFPPIPEIRERIQGIVIERKEAFGEPDVLLKEQHLTTLSTLLGQLDAELWRRTMSLLTHAKLSANTKDHIVAHDKLIAAKRMFSDELDLRWQLAEKMFEDDKVVPKKVRQDPGRYRERRYGG